MANPQGTQEALSMRRKMEENEDGEDEDEDDPRAVELRRVAYLRRHREKLQQQRRLETERRVQEAEADVAAIRARRDDVRAAIRREKEQNSSALAVAAKLKLRLSGRLPELAHLPGIYARFDDLETGTLRLLADRHQVQAARDRGAPLNSRGKYHTRYMKDAYPIAGVQLTLERERELGAAAKKKLLLTDTSTLLDGSRATLQKSQGSANYTFLTGLRGTRSDNSHVDYYVDKLATALQEDQERVHDAEAERQIRLTQVQHRCGLESFWRLMHAAPKREVVAWLKFHAFLDVNVPVRLAANPGTTQKEEVFVLEDKTLGVTPLMAACRCLSVELVRGLLEHGAVVQLATANGDTAMHFLWRDWVHGSTDSMKDVAELALRTQHVQDILVQLISRGADVNAQNAFGETALQFCAHHGLRDCAKLLLAHGADAFICDRKAKSAAQYAQDSHYEGLHQLLLHYDVVERTRARESERMQTSALLRQKRGALTASWSQTPEHFFSKLRIDQQRAGRLRNQYIDHDGHVLVCSDSENEG